MRGDCAQRYQGRYRALGLRGYYNKRGFELSRHVASRLVRYVKGGGNVVDEGRRGKANKVQGD